MPKIKRNEQFHAQEEKIRDYLSDRKLLLNKTSLKIEEFEELLNIAKIEAGHRELEPSQFVRWLLWRFLSAHEKIEVSIDKYEPMLCADEDLKTEKPKFIKLHGSQNGVRAYKKYFGNELQQRIIQREDESKMSAVPQ